MLAVTYSGSGFGQETSCPAGQHSFTFPWGVSTCVTDDAAPPDTSAISADSTPTCPSGQHLFTFPWGVSTCVSDDAPAIDVNAAAQQQTTCSAGQHLFTFPWGVQTCVDNDKKEFFNVKNPKMWLAVAGGVGVIGIGSYFAFRKPAVAPTMGRRRRRRR